MNTKFLISGLIILTIAFSFLTIRKMKANAQKAYEVITWDKYDICFLVGPEYSIDKTEGIFSYKAGKNSGKFTLEVRELDPKMKSSSFGDFQGGYSKEIDYRTFEYIIAPGVILKDRFDFAKKNIPNLLPVRSNCSKYLERFPIKFKL